jgi:glycosyltransferase involved in cell wall biosynthesis
MTEPPKFSVIMPLHREHERLADVRSRVHSARSSVELIMVLNDVSVAEKIKAERPDERTLTCERPGRGFAFARGVAEARGEITVLLHGDTLLPAGWDRAILAALSDARAVGGGFHMAFDRSSGYLDFLVRLSNLMVFMRRAMWGDRAIFARTVVLHQCIPALDVPLFEDVRLSKALRRRGKLVLLDETVITSADHFWKNGPFTQSMRILRARTWYALGGKPQKIYDYYYSR